MFLRFISLIETQIQDEWVLGGIRLLNLQTELTTIQQALQLKKETGFGATSFEIPTLPPPVTLKEGSLLKGGLFHDEATNKTDTGTKCTKFLLNTVGI